MSEIAGRCKKSLQTCGSGMSWPPPRSSDIAVDSRGLGSEIELLPNGQVADAALLAGAFVPDGRTNAEMSTIDS
jgi:hypothetical protein